MLKKITGIQGSGQITGPYEIQILIDFNRDITADEAYDISNHARQIMEILASNNVANDPKTKIDNAEAKAKFKVLFGNQAIYMEAIPNGYFPESHYYKHFPWYKITTSQGHFIIGWRKRVIEIDWSQTTIKLDANDLFPSEDVTKSGQMIHDAWGYDKAAEYIEVLMQHERAIVQP